MEILKTVGTFTLNRGDLAAKGLYNIHNSQTDDVTIWFDDEKKEELMSLTDKGFTDEAKRLFSITRMV